MKDFMQNYRYLSKVLDSINWGNESSFVPFYKCQLFLALAYVHTKNWLVTQQQSKE